MRICVLLTGRGRYTDDIIPTANDACLRAALARGARAYQTHRRSRGAAHAWRAICGYCRVAIEAGHPTLPPPTSGIALWSGSSRLRERILPFGYLPNADARAAEDASNLTDAAHLHSNAVAVLLETEDKKPRNYSRRGMHGLGKHRLRCLTHPAPGVLLVGTDHEEEPRKTRLCAGSGGSCQAPFLGQWLRPRGLSLMGASESRKSSGMRSSIEWSATEPQAAAERVL